MPAAAGTSRTIKSDTIAGPIQPKAELHLTQSQRQQTLQRVNATDTDDPAPPDFHPGIGAAVPSQKKLPLHPFPQQLVGKIPVLKQYYYAKLPNNVLIVDPMTRKVVEVIAR
jgi:hypothetical protein